MSLANFSQEAYKNFIRKLGRITTFTGVGVIWDGADGAIAKPDYPGWLAAEDTITAVSDSADDAPAGTGAYQLTIVGQGDDGLEITDTVNLNGLTPVNFTKKFAIIYDAFAVNADAVTLGNTSPVSTHVPAPANHGTISIYPSTGTANMMAVILPNLGRSQMALWRCPKNKWAELKGVNSYSNGVQSTFARIFARKSINESWQSFGSIDEDGYAAEVNFPIPEYIYPGMDLCAVISSQTSSNVTIIMFIELHDIPEYDAVLAEESL